MTRCNGSIVGPVNEPTNTVASGVWRLREAATYLQADEWPSQPAVPPAPAVVAENAQVSLSWAAPSGGSPITDYAIEYSSNSGSTWTTFQDGVSTATSAVVTGLTNGTAYIFRLVSINPLGEVYGSASASTTPFSFNTTLLLHFDGNLSDSSGNNLQVTAGGAAAPSTAQSKFGGSSLELAASDSVSVSPPAGFQLGTAAWTIEAWAYMRSVSLYSCLLEIGNHGGGGGSLFVLGDSGLQFYNNGTFYGSGATVTLNQWQHVAASFDGTTLRIFTDGVQRWSGPFAGDLNDGSTISIGYPLAYGGNSAYAFDGYIDEMRIVKGTSLYNGDFPIPTGPF